MLGGQVLPCPLRFCSTPGFEGRSNDVVYCGPVERCDGDAPNLMVYFGGDVQDFTENMQSHRDNIIYVKWNLENTARLLQMKFPASHVMVIRPARMELKTFSCFDNFVPAGNCGTPQHTPMHHSILHLEKLICNVSERLQMVTESDLLAAMELSKKAMVLESNSPFCPFNITREDKLNAEFNHAKPRIEDDLHLENYDIKLLGFSKGCVVLNQFLYEFHYFKTLNLDDSSLSRAISKIKDMYWLDGGHSGGMNTWITSRPLLETLSGLGIKIHIHVTPYQIRDERRPWIKKEERQFSDILRKQGSSVDRTIHFEHVTPTLLTHFDVLKVFE